MPEDQFDGTSACDLDSCIASYEEHERNLADLEDSRFGEIYLDDKMEDYYAE